VVYSLIENFQNYMKNKLLSLVVVSSFILLPMATFAEEAGFQAGQGDREGRREALQNKKGEIKDSIRERKDNAVDQIQNRLNKFIQNVIDRFDAAVERLEQLTLRIESRIAKLDTESVNTAKAKELLVIAKSKIQIAKTSISLIQFATTTATSTASTI
jgi:Ni/Co efflux regulator RcnB